MTPLNQQRVLIATLNEELDLEAIEAEHEAGTMFESMPEEFHAMFVSGRGQRWMFFL